MTILLAVGSRARRDADNFSDRDFVLIENNLAAANTRSQYIEKLGGSVTVFTPRRFAALAGVGALFVGHTILEGRLVSGQQADWAQLQRKWALASSYEDEIQENLDFLSLLRTIPRTRESYATTVDVMVCSVRNILIRELAGRGDLQFAWSSLASTAVRMWKLSSGFRLALAWGRRVKNCWRVGQSIGFSESALEEFSATVRPVLRGARIAHVSRHRVLERSVQALPDYSYGQLRGIELLISRNSEDPALRAWKSLVRNPSYFLAAKPVF